MGLLVYDKAKKKKPQKLNISKASTLVGLGGLEPLTSTMSTWRSNQLSYNPKPSTERIIAQPSDICKREIRKSCVSWKSFQKAPPGTDQSPAARVHYSAESVVIFSTNCMSTSSS